jgi:hypothetical protein
MQTIELSLLTRVTGGSLGSFGRSQGRQQPDAQYDAQAQSDGGQGGGGFMSTIDGILGFLGSDSFANIVNGFRQALAGFGSLGSQGQGDPQADMQGDPNGGMMQG